jgi:hypothetical protein
MGYGFYPCCRKQCRKPYVWSPILLEHDRSKLTQSTRFLQPPQSPLTLPRNPTSCLEVLAACTGLSAKLTQLEVGLSSTPTLLLIEDDGVYTREGIGSCFSLFGVWGGHKHVRNTVIFIPKFRAHNQETSSPKLESISCEALAPTRSPFKCRALQSNSTLRTQDLLQFL